MSKRLSPAQERAMRHAEGMAALGLPFARVPAGYERCFLAGDLLDDGIRPVTLRALIRKGRLAVVAIAHIHDDDDVILRIQDETA